MVIYSIELKLKVKLLNVQVCHEFSLPFWPFTKQEITSCGALETKFNQFKSLSKSVTSNAEKLMWIK